MNFQEGIVPQPKRPERTPLIESVHRMLVDRARKVDEGKQGVIFFVSAEDMREAVELSGLSEIEQDGALKVLKIERSGLGEREALFQERARSILERARHSSDMPIALVPKMYFTANIPLDAKDAAELEKSGLHLSSEAQAILMEYIPGKDLGRILFEEVAKRHPALKGTLGDPGALSFPVLSDYVAEALKFTIPGGKSGDPGEREYERTRIEQQNTAKLFEFLEQTDFHLPDGIFTQVKNALDALHEKKFYLRDFHVRNLMIVDSDAYIIDFGAAVQVDDESKAYEEGEVRYVEDDALLSIIKRFSLKERKAQQERKRLAVLFNFQQSILRFQRSPTWKSARSQLLLWLQTPEPARMKRLILPRISQDPVTDFCVVLASIAEEVPDMNASIEQVLGRELPIPVANTAQRQTIRDTLLYLKSLLSKDLS